MLRYAFKRVLRGHRLFLALTIGVLIATTFFGSMIISADVLSKEALTNALGEIDYDARIQANNMTWTTQQYAELDDLLTALPEVTSADRFSKFTFSYNATLGQSFDIIGVEQDTTVWNSLQYINGSTTLGTNETYVVASSTNASLLSIGQVIEVPVRFGIIDFPFFDTTMVNLTVAGFVDIPERTARLLNPPRFIDLGFFQIEIGDWREYDLLIVDWGATIEPIVAWYEVQEDTTQLGMTQGFIVQLNRDLLINPYDLGASSTNVANALAKVEDRTALYNTQVTNLIGGMLAVLSFSSTLLLLVYLSLAAPIIFMSWYSSTMLSDVSYNLRRREFGLLQTKGFGPKTIKRMLMLEGVIIGLIGGAAGLVLSTILAHVIVNVEIGSVLLAIGGNLVSSIAIVVFGLIISTWSVRGPAHRAANLEPLDSLKQYVYVEEQREYKKLLPTIALVLGSYKIIVWMLGISIEVLVSAALGTNFILFIAAIIWVPIDAFLNFVGPIMFLYGLTKILLRGSQKFQEVVMKAGRRFFGAFGTIATRNVRRNPARNSALVFVVALIVSYGAFSVGSLFSEQDRLERSYLFSVGADVSADFPVGYEIGGISQTTLSLDDVVASSSEYHITMSTTRGALETRAIDPQDWKEAAFYETNWFSHCDLDEVFSNFTGSQILLSVSVARQLELRVGNQIAVRGPSSSIVHLMEIVGLVGYVAPFEDILGQFAFGGAYPSFIPIDFLNETGLLQYAEGRLLLKTDIGANGTLIEENLKMMYPEIVSTDSYTTQISRASENTFQIGGTRARWLAVIFAGVLAVVGTGLVVGLTLKEKEYETTLLSVRGLTNRQVLKVLIGEVMVMVMFSLILGTFTGFIQLYGDISNTSQNTQGLIHPRVVLSPIAVLSMLGIVFAVIMAVLIPVFLASRFTEEKIDVLRE